MAPAVRYRGIENTVESKMQSVRKARKSSGNRKESSDGFDKFRVVHANALFSLQFYADYAAPSGACCLRRDTRREWRKRKRERKRENVQGRD